MRIGRSTNRAGWGLKVIPESREGSRIPPVGPGCVRRPSWRVRRGREAHLNGRGGWNPSQQGWEELGVPHRGREGSRGTPVGPVRAERPFWSAGRGCEGRERSGVSPGGPGVVERPSRKGREELGGPPGV